MSNITLRALSKEDGHLVYRLLQKIPAHENGFYNGANGLSFEAYKQWLIHQDDKKDGRGLREDEVPESIYWLIVDEIPVGMGKIRHQLTPALELYGGNISYSVASQYRNKGYGTRLLQLLVDEARYMEMKEMLITIYNYNYPSISLVLKNGGVCYNKTELRSYFII